MAQQVISREEAMDRFKQVCLEEHKNRALFNAVGDDDDEADRIMDMSLDVDNDEDWHSLGLGFFKALGFPSNVCHELSREAVQVHNHWCPI
jgi:hypothetical protein